MISDYRSVHSCCKIVSHRPDCQDVHKRLRISSNDCTFFFQLCVCNKISEHIVIEDIDSSSNISVWEGTTMVWAFFFYESTNLGYLVEWR